MREPSLVALYVLTATYIARTLKSVPRMVLIIAIVSDWPHPLPLLLVWVEEGLEVAVVIGDDPVLKTKRHRKVSATPPASKNFTRE